MSRRSKPLLKMFRFNDYTVADTYINSWMHNHRGRIISLSSDHQITPLDDVYMFYVLYVQD